MPDSYVAKPLSPLRKVIAARMTEANRNIPHFRVSCDIEVDALLLARQHARERDPQAPLSINDLLIKAVALSLVDVPAVNVCWNDTEIHEHRTADISIVVGLQGGGVMTPVVRNAEVRTVWELSREIRDLVSRARSNALRMTELVGGSFSVSNLGMYDVDRFDAIINAPQCAILAVGAVKPRVIGTADLDVRVVKAMTATLSLDHRAIDGATGAQFLSTLKQHIERPEGLFAKSQP